MKKANIRVAKEGKDLNNNNIEEESLNTIYLMPKIVVQKQISTSTDHDNPAKTSHGLSYAPVCIRFVRDYNSAGAYKILPFGAIGTNNWIDDDYIYGYYGEVYNPNTGLDESAIYYAVIFSDSINSASDDTPNDVGPELLVYSGSMNNPRFKVTAPHCDYLKVSKSGLLTLNVPSSSLADGGSQSYSASYIHEQGQIPIVAPFDAHFDDFLLNEYYDGGMSNIPSTIVLNDLGSQLVEQILPSYSQPDVYEYITYYFNGTGLYLEYKRGNFSGETKNCLARTIKLYYTIFQNQLDENLNLLN